jgi:hypothetical protein
VDYLEDGETTDPEFFAQIEGAATAFALADGESKAIRLNVVRR